MMGVRTSAKVDELQKERLAVRARGWFGCLFPNLRDAAIRWSEDDAGSLAASVAYYLALSFFPMLLLLTTGIGLFLRFSELGHDAQKQLLETVSQHASPVIEAQVSQVLQQLKAKSIVGGPVGTIAAILTAIGVFAQLDRGFDRIWRIPTRRERSIHETILSVIYQRMWAFCMLLGLGGMVVLLFVSQMAVTHVYSMANSSMPVLSHFFHAVQYSFVVAANALLFGMVFKWLPKKDVGWSEALRGGLLVAVIWELGRVVLGVFLIGMQYTSAYGVIGSFIAVLLWCYYGMCIVFFGAEYVQVLQRRQQERAMPHAIRSISPLPTADSAFSNPAVESICPASALEGTTDAERPRIRPRNRQRQ